VRLRRLRVPALALVALAGASLAPAPPAVAAPERASTRVVGGTEASIADWPYLVSLRTRVRGESFVCGGNLIDDRHVLTAAHCVLDGLNPLPVAALTVVAGREDPFAAGVEASTVRRLAIHPGYKRRPATLGEGGPYDVALLELAAPVGQAPIRLATEADAAAFAPGVLAGIAGWGATRAGGGAVDRLRAAQVPILADAVCAAQTGISAAEAALMLCAGYSEGGIDTCQGDSGGPLAVTAADGAPLLAGLVSWGVDCARPATPGVYVRAATIVPWVQRALGDAALWEPPAGGDSAAPLPRPQRAVGRAGATVRLEYRILRETGATRQTVRIRRSPGGPIVRRLPAFRNASNRPGRTRAIRFRIPGSWRPGWYAWCMTSRDTAGNVSRERCAALIVRP